MKRDIIKFLLIYDVILHPFSLFTFHNEQLSFAGEFKSPKYDHMLFISNISVLMFCLVWTRRNIARKDQQS